MTAAEPLMTSKEVADYLNVSQATLSRWRSVNDGPTWINLRGISRYRREDLDAWLDGKKVGA